MNKLSYMWAKHIFSELDLGMLLPPLASGAAELAHGA